MISISLLINQINPPLAPHCFYRGAISTNAYFAPFTDINGPWDVATKQLFVKRIFEASKTEELWKDSPAQFEIVDSDQAFLKIARNFSSLKNNATVENATVYGCARFLKSEFPSLYRQAKPFTSKALYRGHFPSASYYLYDYVSKHPRVNKQWLSKELKLGSAWENKYPEYDRKIGRSSLVMTIFRRLYPKAVPKQELLGYSVRELLRSTL